MNPPLVVVEEVVQSREIDSSRAYMILHYRFEIKGIVQFARMMSLLDTTNS